MFPGLSANSDLDYAEAQNCMRQGVFSSAARWAVEERSRHTGGNGTRTIVPSGVNCLWLFCLSKVGIYGYNQRPFSKICATV